MTVSLFWGFSFLQLQQITLAGLWPTASTNKMAAFTLLKHFVCTQWRAVRFRQSGCCSAAVIIFYGKNIRGWKLSKCKARDCATAEQALVCVKNVLTCMLWAMLHCLPLSHPCRAHTLRLLFSQSTPLPPARHLTRWRSHLLRGVRAPTQDFPLNLWPTHLNLALRAHRVQTACSSHRMGRWRN